jgi:hypothetical protein
MDTLGRLRAADEREVQGIATKIANDLVLLVPGLGQTRRIFDAIGDTRGSRNVQIFLEKMGWGWNITEPAQRNWFGRLYFGLTGLEHIAGGEGDIEAAVKAPIPFVKAEVQP